MRTLNVLNDRMSVLENIMALRQPTHPPADTVLWTVQVLINVLLKRPYGDMVGLPEFMDRKSYSLTFAEVQ